MKKSLKTLPFFFFLFLMTSYTFGQIRFEKGYFIDNENIRTECLIKNIEWKDNPVDFIYKYNEADEINKNTIDSVKEFGIYGNVLYRRFNVKIDNSSDNVNRISLKKDPVWSEETLFLKLLVDGKASLYIYEDGNIERYFYSVKDSPVTQLIYRKYLNDKAITYNNKFRQQLWIDVRCDNTKMKTVEYLNYRQKDLKKYFMNYNECMGDTITTSNIYNGKSAVHQFKNHFYNLKVTSGISNLFFSADHHTSDSRNFSFGTQRNIRFGLESEFVLPFNKNKWSLFFEPTYQYFSAEDNSGTEYKRIDFKTIEFPIGLRYYFFLNKNFKLYLNASYISSYAMYFDSKIEFEYSYHPDLEFPHKNNFAFGGGFDYKRFNLGYRYYLDRHLWNPYYTINYERTSIIIGYKLLKSK
ncbi:hypothetical protein [Saccharicrinis sp. FJH54]|uniref:hypothetical protein n=1 Tax=Saccharicrinis sp. FJH54 TaxID=3344665 RepID=UPI0035D430A6